MRRKFDAVEMKRKAQEEIYKETKDLCPEELVEYFRKAGESFWREISGLREGRRTGAGEIEEEDDRQ